MPSRFKIVITGINLENIQACTNFANRLAGLDHRVLSLDKNLCPLRILEIACNNNNEVELWNIQRPTLPVPDICLFEAHGLVLIGSEIPKQLFERSKYMPGRPDFPILWLTTDKSNRPPSQPNSNFNIYQSPFTSPTDETMANEFNTWLSKIVSGSNRGSP